MHSSATTFISGDPTNHGANVGAVALFALGIFALIGLLAFLITRGGRRPLGPAARSQPMPAPRRESDPEPESEQSPSAALDVPAQ
ncbi:hypothetical protein KDL01_18445 [Actinospica durhamensis]|uniref:Uncharacterized protein n=1 Tax=Actinospica durhamensis TaxID=1508375 RepID=A0A941INC7_9ACTN|nr:hypothetical protein [Actinospica durhamensis]MBR7835260.1 hypothetical protein [Actinospica durhamensis]